MEVEIRKILKNKDSYMITIPKTWAEELITTSKYVALYKENNGKIIILPWLIMEAREHVKN